MIWYKSINLKSFLQGVTVFSIGMVFGIALLGQVRPAGAASVQRFSLLAATMQPIDSTIGYDSEDGLLRTTRSSTTSDDTAYRGQVNLPDGATIVAVTGFALDTDPVYEFCYRLERYRLENEPVYEAVTERICSGELSQAGNIVLPSPVLSDKAVVDNQQYSYAIFMTLPMPYNEPFQDLGVLRFVVDSTYQVHLPLVQRR